MNNNHPYFEFKGSKLWKSISAAVADLEKNQDLKTTTDRNYVIGFLCKRLVDQKFVSSQDLPPKKKKN
jgi:hypothetical protein